MGSLQISTTSTLSTKSPLLIHLVLDYFWLLSINWTNIVELTCFVQCDNHDKLIQPSQLLGFDNLQESKAITSHYVATARQFKWEAVFQCIMSLCNIENFLLIKWSDQAVVHGCGQGCFVFLFIQKHPEMLEFGSMAIQMAVLWDVFYYLRSNIKYACPL